MHLCVGIAGILCVVAYVQLSATFTNSLRHSSHEKDVVTAYISFADSQPMKDHFHKCAYVSGSGHLFGSGLGGDIDAYDCVIRSNDAPVTGYEEDVGEKTTFRTVDLQSLSRIMYRIGDKRYMFDKYVKNETFVIAYECPERVNMLKSRVGQFLRRWTNMKFYILTTEQAEKIRHTFASRVAELGEEIWISNGFTTLLFMREICDEIHVYGIADHDYCRRVSEGHPDARDVPYHYYDDTRNECSFFQQHADLSTRAHRFIEEKRLFALWIEEWKNLFFHRPEWPT